MTKVRTDDQYYYTIANAIRYRNGGSLKYKSYDLASAIYTIFDGTNVSKILITAPAGTVITATCNGVTETVTVDSTGKATISDCAPGTWDLSMTYHGFTINKSVAMTETSQSKTYSVTAAISEFGHTIIVNSVRGSTIRVSGSNYNNNEPMASEQTTFTGVPAGTYTVESEGYGASKTTTVTIPASVTTFGTYTVSLLYDIPPTVTAEIFVDSNIFTTSVYFILGDVRYNATNVASGDTRFTKWVINNFPRDGGILQKNIVILGSVEYVNIFAYNTYNGTNTYISYYYADLGWW